MIAFVLYFASTAIVTNYCDVFALFCGSFVSVSLRRTIFIHLHPARFGWCEKTRRWYWEYLFLAANLCVYRIVGVAEIFCHRNHFVGWPKRRSNRNKIKVNPNHMFLFTFILAYFFFVCVCVEFSHGLDRKCVRLLLNWPMGLNSTKASHKVQQKRSEMKWNVCVLAYRTNFMRTLRVF